MYLQNICTAQPRSKLVYNEEIKLHLGEQLEWFFEGQKLNHLTYLDNENNFIISEQRS